MSKPLDTEVQGLTGQVHIYMEHSAEWTDEVRQHHRKVLRSNFTRLLKLPVQEVSESVWDELVDALDGAGIMPETVGDAEI